VTRVLITGGAGFIGLHLARRLLDEGITVDLLDDFSRGRRDRDLEAVLARPGVDVLACDLLQPEALTGLDRDYQMIFHLAAIVGVENVVRAPYRVLDGNVRMLSALLGFASRQPALHRFLFASTSEVYAGGAGEAGFVVPTPETVALRLPDMAQPRSSYLLSKIYGEALCAHAGLPVTVVRPHNVYGPRMGMAHVIPQLLRRIWEAPEEGSLEIHSPDHTRAFCYVDDATEVMIRLAFGEAGLGGTFNVGNQSEELPVRELARRLLALAGRRLALIDGPETAGSPRRRCPDMAVTRAATCFTPAVSLAEGLERTHGWYLANREQGREVAAA